MAYIVYYSAEEYKGVAKNNKDDLPNALWGAATAFLPNATPFYARLWERMSILRFSSIVFRELT